MTHEELAFAIDAEKNSKANYIILYKTEISQNGNIIRPFICKASEIHLGSCSVNFGNRHSIVQIMYSNIVSIDKADNVTFGKTFGK